MERSEDLSSQVATRGVDRGDRLIASSIDSGATLQRDRSEYESATPFVTEESGGAGPLPHRLYAEVENEVERDASTCRALMRVLPSDVRLSFQCERGAAARTPCSWTSR
jgi:hypothetical protein